jgi:DNA repair exonuclease SbcCD nuclease subunit
MKFVHAADLHLDSPLRTVRERAPLDRIRTATRAALANLVELCLSERASLLVIAGDVYDGDWRDYSTGLYFAHQMARLREAGVQVVMIRGNHDAASQITKSLRLPDNVRELPSRRPETLCFDDLGIAVHGQSFANRAVTDNLVTEYPAREPQLLNIGLLHTSITGRAGHEPYAPCALDDLRSKGYDYWALGHVHNHEIVERAQPWVVFPGNLQGRHARETGVKGAMLVEYDASGIESVELRALDVARYTHARLDLGDVRCWDDALDRVRPLLERELAVADGRVLGVRIELSGHTALHARLMADDAFLQNCQALAEDIAGEELWIEKLVVHTASEQRSATDADDGGLAELLAAIAGARADGALLDQLGSEVQELRNKLPAELREGPEGLAIDDPEQLSLQLEAALQLLQARLTQGPEPLRREGRDA